MPRPGTSPGSAEHLSARDFERLGQFIQLRSGIKMPPEKKTMLESRLRRRILALGMTSLAEYCHYLFEQRGLEEEATNLIDAVTTNKTDFFREIEHFRFLTENAVPLLLAERSELRRSPLKIWSAACSNGAEPYTLAMVLSELKDVVRDFSILATDICSEVLKTAVRGIYPSSMAEPIPHDLRRRYLLRSKESAADSVRVVPDLRRSVQFGRLTSSRPRTARTPTCMRSSAETRLSTSTKPPSSKSPENYAATFNPAATCLSAIPRP